MHRQRNSQTILLAFSILFFSGLLVPQSTIPQYLAYAATLAVYFVVLLYILSERSPLLQFPRWAGATIGVIALVGCSHLAINPSVEMVLRAPIFLVIAIVNITYLPNIIPVRYFYSLLARLSAIVVCIGLLPLLGLPTTVGWVDISLWGGRVSLFSVQFNPITSVFNNPNHLGFLSLVGILCASAERRLYRTRVSLGLLSVSALGLLLAYYRAGWLALTAFVLIYLSYRVWGKRGVIFTTLVGGVSVLVLLAVIFQILPGPAILQTHGLNGRRELWLAGVTAFQEYPVFGQGFGMASSAIQPYLSTMERMSVHNSFLRMFIETGLIGGGAYLIFHLLVITRVARSISTERSAFLLGLVVAFTVVQLFTGFTMFGISMQSTVVSLGYGYGISIFQESRQ